MAPLPRLGIDLLEPLQKACESQGAMMYTCCCLLAAVRAKHPYRSRQTFNVICMIPMNAGGHFASQEKLQCLKPHMDSLNVKQTKSQITIFYGCNGPIPGDEKRKICADLPWPAGPLKAMKDQATSMLWIQISPGNCNRMLQ